MLEYLAEVLERISSNEKGKTGMKFFTDSGCGGVASGRLDAYQFVLGVESLSDNTDFYAKLRGNLTPPELRRVVDELGFIRRPMQSAVELLHVAQQCSGFRKINIVLLNSLPARRVQAWQLGKKDISLTARLRKKFHNEVKKKKNIHAEMMLMTYFLGLRDPRTEVFPYLGVSKKTCLLCGHMLEGKLDQVIPRLRDFLREEATEEDLHRNAEKETASGEDERLAISNSTQDGIGASRGNSKGPKTAYPTACPFCKDTGELAYICQKCGVTAYCGLDCYREDWYRHKFSCTLGRSIDATDYLVLACHTNQFPQDDDVAEQYGFMYFATGKDRLRLFEVYRRLIIEWGINEEELRAALKQNKLKEILTFRCSQTRDAIMLSDSQWLESQEGFGVNGKKQELLTIFEAAREELLSCDERKLPFAELRPPEKRYALLFYVQICNGIKPDVDEDNWISLGFCTAPDAVSEDRLCSAYESLVGRCTFNEFWGSMAESAIVELFDKYGLTDIISPMRNFKDFMASVKKWHQSVWELKRFTRMNVSDPFRAVVVDYGFMNCKDAHQRMQLRSMYQEYFERGEDEMRLHEACVAGQLASFLQTVFGGLPVPSEILRNFYPLENCPLMGMVTDSVTVCPESALDQVKASNATRRDKSMIMKIADSEDDALKYFLYRKTSFLGIDLRKQVSLGSKERVFTTLSM
ncbi:hypothetical protein UCREL1_11423 [Eutypa lata UCREL1]|uniref:MYND-type domain-containing protein n=1 Tax=Eutypa lata (strain UCR-EL1) TaxID=1287681 RepID=M7T4W0_EUTLA|nr:hypothetical protein UCREL1_11423 [Eutypa lata UCREL1]